MLAGWPTQAGGGGSVGTAVATFADASAIVTGLFSGTAAFGSTTLTSSGDEDIFIAKLNANGSFAWATRAGGADYDIGNSVAVLADGSAIVTGWFHGTATFGGTTLFGSSEHETLFVAKLNANGSSAWATRAGGTDSEGSNVKLLPNGSAIVTGNFSNTATFGGTTLTSSGDQDIFIAKLNANGSFA